MPLGESKLVELFGQGQKMNIDETLALHNAFFQRIGSVEGAATLVLAHTLRQQPAAQPSPANLSVKQAAKEMGISSAKVYQLCESGQLRHRKIGRAIRIQQGDLQAFMDSANQEGSVSFPQLGI